MARIEHVNVTVSDADRAAALMQQLALQRALRQAIRAGALRRGARLLGAGQGDGEVQVLVERALDDGAQCGIVEALPPGGQRRRRVAGLALRDQRLAGELLVELKKEAESRLLRNPTLANPSLSGAAVPKGPAERELLEAAIGQSEQSKPVFRAVRYPDQLRYDYYQVVHWSEFDRGGHFAAMEAPDLLVEDVRAFFRTVR